MQLVVRTINDILHNFLQITIESRDCWQVWKLQQGTTP